MPWSCNVRIISSPVRSPTWARRGYFVAAEIALEDAAVGGSIEDRAPSFEFAHAVGSFTRVEFRHAPVVDVLAAAHRVGEVDFPIVPLIDIRERRRDSAPRP
jgi:hypothetical protein